MRVKVGCCGWSYFRVPKEERGGLSILEAYAQRFSLVEVNSTFYKLPRVSTCEKWWKMATGINASFEFTVKAHQDITHTHKFAPNKQTLEILDKMVEVCKALHARILLFQTPRSFRPTDENLKNVEEFFATVGGRGLTYVWEMRGEEWSKEDVRGRVEKILREHGVVHCVDVFLESPMWIAPLSYVRLHGLGKRMYYYKFTNRDLLLLKERLEQTFAESEEVYVLFNNIDMYDDAMRFMSILRGESPPEKWGVDALLEKLQDLQFPVTKQEILERFGKRKFFKSPEEYVSVESIIKKIPERSYSSMDELRKVLKNIV